MLPSSSTTSVPKRLCFRLSSSIDQSQPSGHRLWSRRLLSTYSDCLLPSSAAALTPEARHCWSAFCKWPATWRQQVHRFSVRSSGAGTPARAASAGKVVVVESPAKAKKLQSYLGSEWIVLASYGHVRQLLAKPGSVDPSKAFAMTWAESARQREKMAPIRQAVMHASQLVLATDPDREGEAIAWHILEQLQAGNALSKATVSRITFTEVTRKAVLEAMANPRIVSEELVDAYRARTALDFLLGFTLSPVLWRKLPAARSAGRVQSVALRLVSERESEIGAFHAQQYFSVDAVLQSGNGSSFPARLTQLDGAAIGQMGFSSQAEAHAIVQRIQTALLQVKDVSRKETRRSPSPPFTTSTLQQAASSRLHMSPSRTMSLAQQLYEGVSDEGEGLITYMRTDGVDISPEAVAAIRGQVAAEYGAAYVPSAARAYKTKAKNAQEAHAAIQPTDVTRTAQSLTAAYDAALQRLYALIRARTMACQMADATMQQVGVDVSDTSTAFVLRATGSDVKFPGFLAAFGLEDDDASASDDDAPVTGSQAATLNALQVGAPVRLSSVQATEHQTRPPPRFTEATLVKALEARGIGRPSTYASTIKLLQDRGYVSKEGRSSRLRAEPTGRLLVAYLMLYFPKYLDYGFTSGMEASLDDVSGGREQWQRLVQGFWQPFNQTVHQADQVERIAVVEAMDQLLEPHLFPAQEGQSQEDARVCPACGTGRLGLKTFAGGGFVGCSSYPDCSFSRPLSPTDPSQAGLIDPSGAILLGSHPDGEHNITIRSGRFGAYVQLDKPMSDAPPAAAAPATAKRRGKSKEEKVTPRRASIPKGTDPMSVSLAMAVEWLAWPKTLGEHPQEGGPVEVCTGGFGPYVRHAKVNAALPKGMELDAVTMDEAVRLLAKRKERLAKQPAKAAPAKAPAAGQPEASKGRRKRAETAQTVAGPATKDSKAKAAAAAGKATKTSSKPKAATKRGSKSSSSARAGISKKKTSLAAKAAFPEKGTEKAAPANPFLRFCQDQRPLVKAEHPGLMLGQVSKVLGERWRALSDAERQSFRSTA